MAVSGFLFVSWRIFQLVLLIPIVGMLSWFVHGYVESNQLTPNFILVLFIVSVLALAWCFATLFNYLRARHDAFFVALIDLGFVGALIGGIVTMRAISNANCSSFSSGSLYFDLGPFGYYGRHSDSPWAVNINKTCAMLKASWALAIIATLTFFVTFVSLLSRKEPSQNSSLTRSRSCSLSWSTATTATTTRLWSSASTTLHATATAAPPAEAAEAAVRAMAMTIAHAALEAGASRGAANTTSRRRRVARTRKEKKTKSRKKPSTYLFLDIVIIRDAASLTGRFIMHKDYPDSPFTTGSETDDHTLSLGRKERSTPSQTTSRLYLAQTIPPTKYHELQTNRTPLNHTSFLPSLFITSSPLPSLNQNQ
jgi:hypothetical protein